MPLKLLADNRFNPFTRDLTPVKISSEVHMVPDASPYWIKLHEVPVEEVPSAVSIPGFREVFTTLSSGDFRVDYKYGTGLIEFDSSAANQKVHVSYRGVGSLFESGFFNRYLKHEPEDSMIAGSATRDWKGTHFSWSPSSAPPLQGWELTEDLSGGRIEHENHFVTFGRSPSVGSQDHVISFGQNYVQYVPYWGGNIVYQFRVRAPHPERGGGFFTFFGDHEREVEAGTNFAPERIFYRGVDPTWAGTVVENDPPLTVVHTVLVSYPGWSTLPVGFGWTRDNSQYFCTFTRTPWHTNLNSWRAVIGTQDIEDRNSLPATTANTLGGHVTDVSTFFRKSDSSWYDVRIELNNVVAKLHVDNRLVALHTTNIPGSPYGIGGRPFRPYLHVDLPLVGAGENAHFDFDYYSVGITSPLSLATPFYIPVEGS